MQTSDINNRSGVMSVNIENRKTRSTESFEVRTNETLQQPTESPTRLPVEYFGIPLVDNDLAGNETFVVIAKRFEKQVVYRFNKQKSLYLFSPRSPVRKFVIFLTTNQYFELFVLLLIITNCILLALKDQPEEIEYVFAALYTMEMILKIIGKGFFLHKFAYLRDPWNCLDFVVVILGYVTMAPSVANFSGIRTFRVLRALRTISVIEGLRTMVNAFLRSMRMLSDVLALSLFFISTFALIGMQLFVGVLRNKCVLSPGANTTDFDDFVANESNWLYANGEPVVCGNSSTARSCPSNYTCFPDVGENPNHGYTSFDTFPWALLCTIQLVTADYWENVYEYIIASNGFWSVFYFLMVIFFGSFYILNLILAVVALSYQQELGNLKNQEAGYNQLKATSSSYSLHDAFKPQKLFPTKPAKLASNWPSVLRRYTKTSPYFNEPAHSPGPYYPSSPDNKTLPVQSPLTLDKVTTYELDNEGLGLVSFYNYEPEAIERINSGANFNTDFDIANDDAISNGQNDISDAEAVENSTTKIKLRKPGKGKANFGGRELNNFGKSACENNTPCESVEDVFNSVPDRGGSSGNDDSDSWKRHDKDSIICGASDRPSEFNKLPKTNEPKALGVSETSPQEKLTKNENCGSSTGVEKNGKNDFEANRMKCVDSLNHENSVTNLLREYETSQGAEISSEASGSNGNPLTVANTDSVLNCQANVSDKNEASGQTGQRATDSSKELPKSAPVAQGDSARKSVEEGLAMVQNTGLVIVQTSSVCVMIPRATDRLHEPVNVVRRRCATLIMNPAFDWLIICVIFVNTVVMATEYHGMNRSLESTLDDINLACTFVFVLEMLVKVTAFSFRGYIQSRWNILDGFIVLISVVELMIVWCVPDVTHGLGFSVLRTFRLIRVLKLAQSWVTMRALLSTIGASIGQLGNLTLLLAIVTYTFAVIGMQLFSESFAPEHFEDEKMPRWNFADFLHSFMIIFRVLCGEWIEPLVMTMHVTTPTAVVFYFAVLIIGNFLILNLFLALLLNSFSTESLSSTNAKRSASLRERFRRLVKKYLNVMHALRASRTSDKTCATENEREHENEDGLEPDRSMNNAIANRSSTTMKSDIVDQYGSRTQSRATAMTLSKHSQKTFRQSDVVVPDCFPRFCCTSVSQDKEQRSTISKAFTLSRAKVLGVVEHRYFDAFILFIIFISSVSLALEDVHLDSKPDLKAFLNVLNYVVTVIFAVEFSLKLFGLGFMKYFGNAWNCLDFFIVMVSVVSLVGSVGGGNLNAFRSLRTLRALRPLRAIPRWQGMKVVVNSLLSAIPEIGNVSLVCLIFWLIFSVMGVQFFGGRFYKCVDGDGETLPHTTVADRSSCLAMNYTWKNSDINFDNSLAGFLALFQVATFEGWIEIMADAADVTEVDKQPQRDKNHVAHLYFVVFVLFGSFFVLNLFVGVIIDNFNRLKKEYESGAVGLFLTESQRAWYETLKKAASKKPRKVLKRPQEEWRALLFDIVNSSKFELTIMILIILNMVFMMMGHHRQSDAVTDALLYSNFVFTVIFFAEALLRLGVQRLDYFKEAWNVFDFVVVVLSIAGLVMEYLNQAFVITPSIFRVVRVFRVGRLLRFYNNARGVRRLLFALLISLPALVNIGALLFLLLFIYAIIGMSSFAYVKHSGAINDMVNFETFRNSMLLLFRLSTSAGWNDVLAPLMTQPPDCDPTYDDLPNGNCGNPYFAIFFFVSFVLISSLIIINMYIAVIMENLHEAFKAEAAGITHDDLDMFYQKWEQYDPHATQYIPDSLLSDFVDSLEEPMRLAKPNKFACINLHIPIQEGDRIHCVDVLQALVRQLLGDIEHENPDAFVFIQAKLEEAFLSAFPSRAKQRTETTTFVRNREICAALVIQKAWREKVSRNRTLHHVVTFH